MSVILVISSLKAWLPAVFLCRCPVGYVVCLVVIILLDYFFLSEVDLLLLILLVFFCCPFLVWVLGKTKPRASHMLGQYFPWSPAQPCVVFMRSTPWLKVPFVVLFYLQQPPTPGTFDPRRDPTKLIFPSVLIHLGISRSIFISFI